MGLLDSILNLITKSAPAIEKTGKAVANHVSKNARKYAAAAGGAAAIGGAYAIGKSSGHTKGKKEGIAEQARKDKAKFQAQHEAHERDRKKWKKQRDKYENLLDELDS